ncbi:carbohydrate ABC transporter permease [[Clostridium] fimetarium]|uniref:Putative aldouronate transport system permease protein n=1 Tax=[Clostridium] fimetarium TaxID=99656 RepID=A0A1I0NQJ2_9FIRM|nr:carbohydrate ABC transporter permease [[Clostridium] fimetarium]SEW03169.1 putative aldouronate transport system permease protein [[Clostridium] fimetarium]
MKTKKIKSSRIIGKIVDAFFWLIIILVSLTCLFPFVHVFAVSISDEAYVVANKVVLLPKGFNLTAYQKIFADSSIIRSLLVTILITVLFTVIGMFLTISAAYALSRKELKGAKLMTFLILFTMYFAAGMIPDYLLIQNLHMLDTIWSLVLPLCFAPFNLLIMKNNFSASIPESLVEAAVVDGAGHFKILTRIVVPLSKPIIATIALFYAVGRWNAYQDALFYIKQRVDLRPLQLKLYYLVVSSQESFQAEGGNVGVLTNPEVLKAACIIFATVPIVIVYPFVQKYFVQGTMVGAVKG